MSNWKSAYVVATCFSSIVALTLKKIMEGKANRDSEKTCPNATLSTTNPTLKGVNEKVRRRWDNNVNGKGKKVKLSLYQAMEAHRVVRR
jgi:hypothetical protein